MRIETLYDAGSSKTKENSYVVCMPFFGVFDGTPAPYSPSNPPMVFGDGLNGGEMVAREIERTFYALEDAGVPIDEVVRRANLAVGKIMQGRGIPLDRADLLPGAAFAFTKVTPETVEVIQGGDTLAVVGFKSGRFYATEIQNFLVEKRLNETIDSIMRHVADEWNVDLASTDEGTRNRVRAEMWDRFFPILSEARRDNVNNPGGLMGYTFLNGQPRLELTWHRKEFRTSEVQTLILFTDGMVPWEVMKGGDSHAIGQAMLERYRCGGLHQVLAEARRVEDAAKTTNYMNFAEATAIAIEF